MNDDMYYSRNWDMKDKRIKYYNDNNYHYFYLNIPNLRSKAVIDVYRLDIVDIEIEKELIE